ncbi:MAG TPA: thiol peroxidase [Candidatus Marinimicrobia bacterium]|nr:thiol peroxidase [Candidatus Neomarinimicrobiota bacterium]
MSEITLKGNKIHTVGTLPALGSDAPDFKVVKTDLSETTLADYAGKRLVLNIFPSLDTDVCAMSVRKFNAEAEKLDNTVVLCVSMDLPFAHKRFCGAEGLDTVVSASDFRYGNFGISYGVKIADGPLAGLLSRAVLIVSPEGKVIYTEQVPEIVQEPDYAAALAALA